MTTTVTKRDMILAHSDIISEGCVGSVHSLFVENMVMTVEKGKICFYHMKQDQVPTSLKSRGVTDSTLAGSVFEWWEYALTNGLAKTIEEVFPQHWYTDDFEKEDRLKSMGVDLTAAELNVLKSDVAALVGVDANTLSTLTSLLGQDGILQQNIDTKQDILTGATSALVTSNLGADFVVITDSSGKVTTSPVTSTTLSFLDTTASVQSLLNLKSDQSALVLEQTARNDADVVIQASVDLKATILSVQSEESTRFAADGVLQGNINLKANTADVETKVDATAKLQQALDAVDDEKVRLDTLLDVPTLNQISEIVTAYDAAIEAADDILEVLVGTKVSQADYNAKVLLLDGEDTLLKTRATDLENAQALKANSADVYTQSAANALLLAKQNVIADGDLTVAKTSGLQTALDSKMDNGDAYLTGQTYTQSDVNNLLLAKQAVIGTDDLLVSYTDGLQTVLDSKMDDGDAYLKSETETYSSSEKATVAAVDQVFTVAEKTKVSYVDIGSGLSALLAAKQNDLTTAQLLDLNAIDQPFTVAQQTKVNAIDQPFTVLQQTKVNAIDQVFTSTQAGNISDNNSKLTYSDASTVASHVTLHAAHATNLAAKQSKLDGTQLHMDSGGTNIGIGTNSPDDELHILGDNPMLKLHSNNPSSSGLVKHFNMGFDSGGNDTMVFSYNPNKSMLFKTSAGNIQLDINDTRMIVKKNLQVDGSEVSFENLPTSDPGVAGRLWDDNGTLKISQ